MKKSNKRERIGFFYTLDTLPHAVCWGPLRRDGGLILEKAYTVRWLWREKIWVYSGPNGIEVVTPDDPRLPEEVRAMMLKWENRPKPILPPGV